VCVPCLPRNASVELEVVAITAQLFQALDARPLTPFTLPCTPEVTAHVAASVIPSSAYFAHVLCCHRGLSPPLVRPLLPHLATLVRECIRTLSAVACVPEDTVMCVRIHAATEGVQAVVVVVVFLFKRGFTCVCRIRRCKRCKCGPRSHHWLVLFVSDGTTCLVIPCVLCPSRDTDRHWHRLRCFRSSRVISYQR